MSDSVNNLKIETHGKLKCTHGGAAFESCDLAVVASLAVDAAVGAIILAEGVHGVVEYVERVHAKLSRQSFVEFEPF